MKLSFASSIAIIAIAALAATAARGETFVIEGSAGSKMTATAVADFDQPWAMTFLSDTELLVTTKPGKLYLTSTDGEVREVSGVPQVAFGGQGGLGDVVPHPDYADNGFIYLSYVESDDGGRTRGAVVVRARLSLDGEPKLEAIQKIWTQEPKKSGKGHFSHRIAFGPIGGPQGGKLFITSGDRQLQTPAQDFEGALGKVIRLNDDGTVPADNPWQDKGALARTFWSIGHRNLLGISFDQSGRLWAHEMGPRHGDELNVVKPGTNYGWPVVSNGDNYSGVPIPDHDTRPEFEPPKAYWVPSIAPSGLVIYSGDTFADWKGDGFIGGLAGQALIRVDIAGEKANEAERYPWGKRIREVEQSPGGDLWVLEDRNGGRLIRLTK